MITFVSHQNINQERWDAAISGSLSPTVFAFYDFLTVAHADWNALVEDDYRHVMPLPCRSKVGVHYVFTPHFVSRLGLFGREQDSEELLMRFFRAIPKKYRQIDLMLNRNNHAQPLPALALRSYQLSLNMPYPQIYAQYATNHKRNIKKANQCHLNYLETGNVEDIIHLFEENKGQEKQVHFKEDDYARLHQLATKALSLSILKVVTVTNEQQQLLCGALFLKDHGCHRFWFSGRNKQFTHQFGMFFLIDEYIKRHAEQSVILDFNGSMDDNIARLYQGFGATPYPLSMLHFEHKFILSPIIRFIKRIKQ
jgi:hypothetical protein